MQIYYSGVILYLLKKETGENPVRARRRETRDTRFSIYTPQYKETPLGNREGEKRSAEVGISFKRNPMGLIKP